MLSLTALISFLASHGLIVVNGYTGKHNRLIILEVAHQNSGNSFMIFIPKSYEIHVSQSRHEAPPFTSWSLLPTPSISILQHHQDQELAKRLYPGIDVYASQSEEGYNNHNELEKLYKQSLEIDEPIDNQGKIVSELVHQIRRLSFCVQKLRYKLLLRYENVLCALHFEAKYRDAAPQTWFIDGARHPHRRLFIFVNLETLYSKIGSTSSQSKHSSIKGVNNFLNEICQVEEGVQDILEMSREAHDEAIPQISLQLSQTTEINYIFHQGYIKFSEYQKELKELLKSLVSQEEQLQKSLNQITHEHMTSGDHSLLHKDLNTAQYRSNIESSLQKISVLRSEILTNLSDVKEKQDDISLVLDKAVFENLALAEHLLSNIFLIQKYTATTVTDAPIINTKSDHGWDKGKVKTVDLYRKKAIHRKNKKEYHGKK